MLSVGVCCRARCNRLYLHPSPDCIISSLPAIEPVRVRLILQKVRVTVVEAVSPEAVTVLLSAPSIIRLHLLLLVFI